jgi:hypothetical protein
MPPALALATLGDAKQINMILFVSCCPRQPRQVRQHNCGEKIANALAKNFKNCIDKAH